MIAEERHDGTWRFGSCLENALHAAASVRPAIDVITEEDQMVAPGESGHHLFEEVFEGGQVSMDVSDRDGGHAFVFYIAGRILGFTEVFTFYPEVVVFILPTCTTPASAAFLPR